VGVTRALLGFVEVREAGTRAQGATRTARYQREAREVGTKTVGVTRPSRTILGNRDKSSRATDTATTFHC
jgi:hypothetical protein